MREAPIRLDHPCDVCGDPAIFYFRVCRIRLCYDCNLTLKMKDRAIGYCFNCGLRLRYLS